MKRQVAPSADDCVSVRGALKFLAGSSAFLFLSTCSSEEADSDSDASEALSLADSADPEAEDSELASSSLSDATFLDTSFDFVAVLETGSDSEEDSLDSLDAEDTWGFFEATCFLVIFSSSDEDEEDDSEEDGSGCLALPALVTGFLTISGSLSEELLEELELEESLDSACFLELFLVLMASFAGMVLATGFEDGLVEETVLEVVIREQNQEVGGRISIGTWPGYSKF
jgi:hypothetical protein